MGRGAWHLPVGGVQWSPETGPRAGLWGRGSGMQRGGGTELAFLI